MSLDLMNALLAVYKGELKRQEPMAQHTSFRVGGPCDLFLVPESVEDLRIAMAFLTTQGVPLTFVGGGTNLLVRDRGIEGAVICLKGTGKLSEKQDGKKITLEVPAGTLTPKLVSKACDKGHEGLVFATGIPGTVGGAIAMNASTEKEGWEDVLTALTVVERSGKLRPLTSESFGFGYRHFEIEGRSRHSSDFPLIVSATLTLKKGSAQSLREARDAKLSRRKESQPTALPSAGCFFKNPDQGPPAGQIIDEVGFKGVETGGAKVSRAHANYIVNTGQATADDILNLAEQIKKKVYQSQGIRLEEEVTVVGRQT